ncbi:MAG: hypothetical protein JWR69_1976 [Pedosphaera sp.]|nr:hypothetical protein [Pedosphaera sp.]
MLNTPELPAPQANTTPERVQMSIRLRFNPIRNLTPDQLSQHLDSFRLGFFRNPALAWEAMERRDTRLQTVAPKRKKSVARHGWEILTSQDTPEALNQKKVLDYFYSNLSATTALEPDEQGGMSLLMRQMMDAVGKRYAVHEITWQPGPNGLTAKFTFCPLWWFEGTQGKLRYLVNEMAVYGQPMEEWGWLVTVGDGIMEACSVAYMFKHMPLKDWVGFSEKFGLPGVLGKTDAAPESPEWIAMEEAVKNFSNDWGAVCSKNAELALVEAKASGEAPFKPLVDMMNEEMTRLWRGGDLGTSSKGNAVGASLQEDETDILEQDDAQMIGETLTNQVSRFVLRYYFGDAPQLAYLKIKTSEKKNVDQELKVDEFLISKGAPISVKAALERYGRPQPEAGEPLLIASAAPIISPTPVDIANAADSQLRGLASALASDLEPFRLRLLAILDIEDPALLQSKLHALLAEFDQIKKDILVDPETAKQINSVLTQGLITGFSSRLNTKKAKP